MTLGCGGGAEEQWSHGQRIAFWENGKTIVSFHTLLHCHWLLCSQVLTDDKIINNTVQKHNLPFVVPTLFQIRGHDLISSDLHPLMLLHFCSSVVRNSLFQREAKRVFLLQNICVVGVSMKCDSTIFYCIREACVKPSFQVFQSTAIR